MQIQASTFHFLKSLSQNNNREWFQDNKKAYELAKQDVEQLVQQLLTQAQKFDKSLEHVQAKDCMFRIFRDVRFSHDKSPYKTNFGAAINGGNKKIERAGYYIHIEPNNSFVAGGWYCPQPDELNKIRQEIDYNSEAFLAILNEKKFKSAFGGLDESNKLKTVPKGYDKENPNLHLLQLKSFIVSKKITDKELTSEQVVDYFKIIYPLTKFLSNAVE